MDPSATKRGPGRKHSAGHARKPSPLQQAREQRRAAVRDASLRTLAYEGVRAVVSDGYRRVNLNSRVERLALALSELVQAVEAGAEYPDVEWRIATKHDVSCDELRAAYDGDEWRAA